MRERRRHTRHRLCFPIRLDTSAKENRLGMCRDGSESGMLFGTPSRYQVGDRITMTFRVESLRSPERKLVGRVVRVSMDPRKGDIWCRRLVAVEFERARPDLGEVFGRESPRQAAMYGTAR